VSLEELHADLITCRRCPRLVEWRERVGREKRATFRDEDYWARPVPGFGDANARVVIVGLAPGRHGANATGRPFTGDHAGLLLYRTLYAHALASAPVSTSADDGLVLVDCRITNAVKCLPPQNKPTTTEVNTCNAYLVADLATLPRGAVVLALGTVAHRATLRALQLKLARYRFAHGAVHALPAGWLVDSYHCSRYNTQTGRLTAKMFDTVVGEAKRLAAMER